MILRFEMGCTPAEFRQRLLAAPVTYDVERAQFEHVENLRLIDPRQRTIGTLRLPAVDVELVFQGYTRADIDAIVTRFHAWCWLNLILMLTPNSPAIVEGRTSSRRCLDEPPLTEPRGVGTWQRGPNPSRLTVHRSRRLR